MTRKGAQVGPSLEWTGGVMSQDIYWDKLNCELNVVCEAFELFNCFFYFVHVHMWGGRKSRQFTVYHMCKTWLQKVHGGWEMGGGVILNKKINKIHWI